MATEVFMPALGIAQDTGKLLEWLVQEGQTVQKGQPLMVIETDKTTVEIEAPASGILANVRARPGEDIPVGQVIAHILEAGESVATAQARVSPSSGPAKAASPVAARLAAEKGLDLSQVPSHGERVTKEDVLAYLAAQAQTAAPAQRVLASPKARRLARESGIALEALKGSGPQGAVLAADVLQAVESRPPLVPSVNTSGIEQPAMVSRMWRTMAKRMSESWRTVPHFFLEIEVNASALLKWKEHLRARGQAEVTITDLLIKLTALALHEHPRLNASWIDEDLVLHEEINIGLAVMVEEGLLVPVIHHADRLGVLEIAARRKKLIAGAQANRLSLEEMSGGTFTLSNLGMFGVSAFSAIINPPEAGILAVGGIEEKVLARQGEMVIQPRMRLTLSLDHRVVDGARGAQFLQTLKGLIEEPLRALE
ncbi:MAG: Dihydrolipoamide acetyltransferase component of pyruvate dehydrogenase complex [Anaerolineae bacterium]|jgi:pyruvate dehydrogenase E2 component (dihydrolipoamide acetyltransferase)|nr:MAG: Dihydrolipoamide acetyltransferase component of pyruvate dehydrogenase complex [Anaerolineae bacterium]